MSILWKELNEGVKTTSYVKTIFEPLEIMLQRQLDNLCLKASKEHKLFPPSAFLLLCGEVIAANYEDACFCDQRPVTLTPNLQEQGQELYKQIEKGRRDLKTFQMWLSLVIKNTPEETCALMPPIILKQFPDLASYSRMEYRIPKGKEAAWKKGEEIAKFCIGLKLLL